MKIYTKTGDKGTTSLIGGTRVKKNDVRVEAYGTLDELDAFVGLVHDTMNDDKQKHTRDIFKAVRKSLFLCCSYMACESEEIGAKLQKPDDTIIGTLEAEIDKLEEQLPKKFTLLILGDNVLSSYFNVLRTICRRAERSMMYVEGYVPNVDFIHAFINRLSDYFYILTRITMDKKM